MKTLSNEQEILHFWFQELSEKDWFTRNAAVDKKIIERFLPTIEAAAACEFYTWRTTPTGRLAEIIVLDQFSRNAFRGQARAFQQDPLALALAQEAVAAAQHLELETVQRAFLLMPYMHSESLLIHQQALPLFEAPGLERNLRSEQQHHQILQRFGRYPRRNAALARSNTEEEADYLANTSGQF